MGVMQPCRMKEVPCRGSKVSILAQVGTQCSGAYLLDILSESSVAADYMEKII